MATRDELIKARKDELIAKGYKLGIVDLAMEWAVGSAGGMVNYALKVDDDSQGLDREKLLVTFLPRYLKDCENWIQAFGHEPGEVPPHV